jgi:hypothetical protein
MARLTHNDYLEQFSDSGVGWRTDLRGLDFSGAGGGWQKIWRSRDAKFQFAIFAGLLGWFVQGFGEFELYVPALAWTAFTLLGYLIGQKELNSTKNRKT